MDELSNNKKNKRSKKIIFVIAIIMIVVIAVAIIISMHHKNASQESKVVDNTSSVSGGDEKASDDADLSDEEIFKDAEKYYSTYSQVLSAEKADIVDSVSDEATTIKNLSVRGFDEFDIVTPYSIGGESYDEEKIVSADSQEKHPLYETYYVNSNDEVWEIYLINNEIFANPLSYNMEHSLDTGIQVLVSEKEYIVSYDSKTNKFFKNIPNESELTIITEDKIDVTLLNELTVERILEYVEK